MGIRTGGFVVVLSIVLVMLLSMTAVLAIVIGMGWVLTQIISEFTLFEATVLVILTAVIVYIILNKVLEFFMNLGSDAFGEDTFPFEEDPHNVIVMDRFAETVDEFDGEAYFRYHIANAIFDDLNDLPRTIGLNTQRELIELSIRLTDPVVRILKRRKKWVSHVTISIEAMRKELNRMGLRPYDTDILQTAVNTVNKTLKANEHLNTIVNDHEWDDFLMS